MNKKLNHHQTIANGLLDRILAQDAHFCANLQATKAYQMWLVSTARTKNRNRNASVSKILKIYKGADMNAVLDRSEQISKGGER